MRKLGLALPLLALLGLASARAENAVGPSNLIFCNKIAVVEAGTSGAQHSDTIRHPIYPGRELYLLQPIRDRL